MGEIKGPIRTRAAKWVEPDGYPGMLKCTKCGVMELTETKFCPECGARMYNGHDSLVYDDDITKHYYNCYLEKEGEMAGWWHYTHIENEEKVPFFIYIHTMDNKTWDGYVTDAWMNGPLIRVLVKNTQEVKEFIFYSYHISRTMTDQLP